MEKLKRYDLYLCSIESQAVYMAFDKPDQVNGVFSAIVWLKLVKPIITSARDKNFFCNGVINIWNSLPDYIVMADTIACFKHRLNCFDFSDYVKFWTSELIREPVSADLFQPWRPFLTLYLTVCVFHFALTDSAYTLSNKQTISISI